jgi:hypothetical protein
LIPYLRGYHYLATVDAYHHLGFTKDVLNGQLNTNINIYPGYHILAAIVTIIGQISPTKSLMFCLSVLGVFYITIIGIFAYQFSHGVSIRWALVGFCIALAFLPLITVRIPIYEPLPTTVALLYLPLPIYLSSIIYSQESSSRRWIFLSYVVGTGLIIYHPQHAVSFLCILLGFGTWKRFAEKAGWGSSPYPTAWVYICVVTVAWISSKVTFAGSLLSIIRRFTQYFVASGNGQLVDTGEVIGLISLLNEAGGSFPELVMKLMAPRLVPLILSLFVLLFYYSRWKKPDIVYKENIRNLIGSLLIGAIPILGLISIYVVNLNLSQVFRYFAVGMLVMCIIAAVSGASFLKTNKRKLSGLLIVLVLISSILAIPLIYTSPYTYQPTGHVQESSLQGLETSFRYQSKDISFMEIRSPLRQQRAAIFGFSNNYHSDTLISAYRAVESPSTDDPPHHFYNHALEDNIPTPRYISISERDRSASVKLYNGILYSQSDYQYVDESINGDRILDSGGTQTYLFHPNFTTTTE